MPVTPLGIMTPVVVARALPGAARFQNAPGAVTAAGSVPHKARPWARAPSGPPSWSWRAFGQAALGDAERAGIPQLAPPQRGRKVNWGQLRQ